MTFPIGGGRVNPAPCSQEDVEAFYQDVAEALNNSGTSTDEKFAATSGATPGYWDQVVAGEAAFNPETHQEVSWQRTGSTVSLFTPIGGGGGDTYMVKVESGGSPGFLDSKIHAASWDAVDTYGSSTHFVVLAANVSDAVRFYAPYNIVKTSSSDGSPGYLGQKFTDTGTYNGTNHFTIYAQNAGTTMKLFGAKSDINTIIAAYLSSTTIGAVRFCKITTGKVSVATESGSEIVPGACAAMPELVYNTGSGRLAASSNLTNILYPSFDPVDVPSGRYKIGKLIPFHADTTKLVLMPVDCRSFAD